MTLTFASQSRHHHHIECIMKSLNLHIKYELWIFMRKPLTFSRFSSRNLFFFLSYCIHFARVNKFQTKRNASNGKQCAGHLLIVWALIGKAPPKIPLCCVLYYLSTEAKHRLCSTLGKWQCFCFVGKVDNKKIGKSLVGVFKQISVQERDLDFRYRYFTHRAQQTIPHLK